MQSSKKTHKAITKTMTAFAFSMLMLGACKKADTAAEAGAPAASGLNGLLASTAPEGFNYNTDRDVQIDFTLLAPDESPLKNVMVSFLDKPEELGGTELYSGVTDEYGKISSAVKLPSYITEVVVDPAYVGVIRNASVKITGATLLCTLGGQAGYSGNVEPNRFSNDAAPSTNTGGRVSSVSAYKYMGAYDADGKPDYLSTTDDVINSKLLSYINASLPEKRAVATYHPDYLRSISETNINITEAAEVFFTFVHEGTSSKNSVAYYTYPTGRPPLTQQDIDTLIIILPNASLHGSGGGLKAGNRINLGKFKTGTSIGFTLISNGWDKDLKKVSAGTDKMYSNDDLNPEAVAKLKRHAVLLHQLAGGIFLAGMEETKRDDLDDKDFNSCIFYVKSNPVGAISPVNVNPIDEPVDSDGDGVNDVYDKFPKDPSRAYINYLPSKNTFGTLAFEDNWPNIGDYDMNDMVMGYRYALINNAKNQTVEINADYVVEAAGANLHNGFGVEFPFAVSAVESVSGSRLTNGQVATIQGNGCEAEQKKAVIIPFDDAFAIMSNAKGFVNTLSENPYQTPDTIRMKIKLKSPLPAKEIGTAPFNPFAITAKSRGREVHLAGYTPTLKANTKLFRTGNDNTTPEKNYYYKTAKGLPFGLAFTEKFNYPAEYKSINDAYLRFIPWVQSGGTAYNNWYKNTNSMVLDNIYKHK